MTGLSIAYGFSKFLMGSVSDRSNPRYFMPLGLCLTALCNFAFGLSSSYYLHLLLWTLNGLVQPSAGAIEVEALGALSDRRVLRLHRQRTGMVFQQHHLIGRSSVLANVLTGRLGYHSALATLRPWSRADKQRALAALERVGLLEQALRRADELSGGQQQRVGIARALVQQPKLLLADEPVASLDPATAERVLALLHGICKTDGLTAVVSLHQVEFAQRFADRIVGLAGGQVVFDGTPAELTPAHAKSLYAASAAGAPRPSAAPPSVLHTLTESIR